MTTQFDHDRWPGTTAVVPQTPSPPAAPAPAEPGSRIGLGMVFALAVLAAVGAAIAAVVLVRHHAAGRTQTVVVTATSPAATPPAAKVRVPVPDLAGQGAASAAPGLRHAGFRVVLTTVPSTLPKGTVVEQQPPPGTRAAPGAEVRLRVSAGAQAPAAAAPTTTAPAPTATAPPAEPATAQVPALSGSLQPATQQLAQAGLRVSIAYVPSTQPLGTVVAQAPDGGSSVRAGSQVTVNVAWGPRDNESETVPNVAGRRIRDAVPALQRAGLRLIFVRAAVTDRAQAGLIVAQTPQPGKQAPRNGQVLVYLGAFSTP